MPMGKKVLPAPEVILLENLKRSINIKTTTTDILNGLGQYVKIQKDHKTDTLQHGRFLLKYGPYLEFISVLYLAKNMGTPHQANSL